MAVETIQDFINQEIKNDPEFAEAWQQADEDEEEKISSCYGTRVA